MKEYLSYPAEVRQTLEDCLAQGLPWEQAWARRPKPRGPGSRGWTMSLKDEDYPEESPPIEVLEHAMRDAYCDRMMRRKRVAA